MPPNPPSKAHGFAMRSMSLRDMQISNSQKKNSWPPPSQILGTPLDTVCSVVSIMYDNKYDDSDYAYMPQYYNIFFTIFKKCFDENLTHLQNIHENHSTVIDTIFTNSG